MEPNLTLNKVRAVEKLIQVGNELKALQLDFYEYSQTRRPMLWQSQDLGDPQENTMVREANLTREGALVEAMRRLNTKPWNIGSQIFFPPHKDNARSYLLHACTNTFLPPEVNCHSSIILGCCQYEPMECAFCNYKVPEVVKLKFIMEYPWANRK